MHVGKTKVATRVPVGQLGVIEPQQVQECGVQIVYVNTLVNRAKTKFVRGAVNMSAFDAAAGKADRETVVIVISP